MWEETEEDLRRGRLVNGSANSRVFHLSPARGSDENGMLGVNLT